MIYIIAPVAVLSAYVGGYFQRTADSDGLTIGEPVLEAEGVTGRRGMVAHPMTPAQVEYARAVLKSNGHDTVTVIADTPPADWRAAVPASPR